MNQTQTTKKTIWLFELLNELQFSDMIEVVTEAFAYCLVVTIIYCDNQEAQALAKNSISHARSKHIDIQQHFIRNKIVDDTLDLQHVFNENQVADHLIKPLLKNKFLKFRLDSDLYWNNKFGFSLSSTEKPHFGA